MPVNIDRERRIGVAARRMRTMVYVCNVCGWEYDEDEQGTKWEELPDDFECEVCGVGKDEVSPAE